jgi:hypothetical protein
MRGLATGASAVIAGRARSTILVGSRPARNAAIAPLRRAPKGFEPPLADVLAVALVEGPCRRVESADCIFKGQDTNAARWKFR